MKMKNIVKNSFSLSYSASFGSMFAIVCVAAGCASEPARRSGVDSSQLCGGNSGKACYGSEPIDTKRVELPGETFGNGESNGNTGGGDGFDPAAATKAVGQAPVTTAANSVPGAGGDAAGGGENPPPKAEPAQGASAAQQQIQQNEQIVKVIDTLGNKVLDTISGAGSKSSPAASSSSGSSAGSAEVKIYTVSFAKDSFVGIADGSVAKNCFVASGTTIEVKGAPEKVTEFEKLGVNQMLTGEVQLVSGSSDSCGLKGKDILYLASHAKVAVKP